MRFFNRSSGQGVRRCSTNDSRRPFRCTVLALFLAGSLSDPAHAVIVRHDRNPKRYLNLGREFPTAVALRRADGKDGLGAEGTLIAANWVLTAAHIASELGPGDPVEVQGKVHPIKSVVVYPDWHQNADMPVDIALVELADSVTAVTPARVYRGSDELGMIITYVGRGETGTGLTGPTHEDRRVRAATNRVDSTLDVFPGTAARGQYPAEGFQLRTTFDAPGSAHATELEGCGGAGDSGAGAYIRKDGVLYVIGVGSGEDNRPTDHKRGRYGVFEYLTRVSHFADWIERVIATGGGAPK